MKTIFKKIVKLIVFAFFITMAAIIIVDVLRNGSNL